MSVEVFVDTNVLLYAHDSGAGVRNVVAREQLAKLWEERSGAVSTQVLQEFYVNLRRKTRPLLGRRAAREIVESYASWTVVTNDAEAIFRAMDIEERYDLSFWDALIVVAAIDSGASVLLSEDLSHGQRFGALRIWNPFRS